jgi:hypothetical protein
MNATLRQLTPGDARAKPGTTVLGLTDNYTGTGFRIGSINTITAHPDCEFKHAVMRSGHDHTNICAVFEYSIAHPHLVALSGRALQKYPYPKQLAVQPRIVFSRPHTASKINNLIRHLLHLHESYFQPDQKLWKFPCCLFATFLMHFEVFSTRFPRHLVMDKVRGVLQNCNLTCDQLRLWSREVRQDFLFKNRRVVPESTEPTMQVRMEKVENNLSELTIQVNDLRQQFAMQNELILKILDACLNPHVPLNHNHISKKRKIIEIEDDALCEPTDMEQSESIDHPAEVSIHSLDPIAPSSLLLQNSHQSSEPTSIVESSGKAPQTPLYLISSLSGVSISMILQDYYKYQLYLGRYHEKVSKGDKSRIKLVVEFMNGLMTKEQVQLMKTITSDFSIISRQKALADEISTRAMDELLKLEMQRASNDKNGNSNRKKPIPKNTVAAVEGRLSKIKVKK